MAEFSRIPYSEAFHLALPARRALQEQYREYVRRLEPESAGQLQLGEGDHPITERARLKAAARAEGINLEIQRRGNTIVFWKTDKPPQPRSGGGRRGSTGRRGG